MKRLTAIILICILLTAGCESSSSTGNKALDGELSLDSDQSLIVAQVTAIYGNEITLALAKEVDESEMSEQVKEQSGDDTATAEQNDFSEQQDATDSTINEQEQSINNSDEEAQSNTTDITTSDSDGDSEKGIPSGDNQQSDTDVPSGDMPTSGNPPSGDMPDIGGDSSDEDSSDKSDRESQTQVTRYSLTGEEMTMMIPVGTPVTTLLGTVTTFSRIAVDNTLKIVTEKNDGGEDIIVAIYIVG